MATLTLPERTNRRIYSAELLHSLRGTSSAPKLFEAINENAPEDAELVKEHVLRGSRSFAARSFRSRNGSGHLQVSSTRTNTENASVGSSERLSQQPSFSGRTALAEIADNNQTIRAVPARLRTSPTPSLKRKKAEAIVKAHGSPTHLRVTAGGRIVPSEQSPLCFPRFGYSAIKTNGGLIKFAPNHQLGKATQWTETLHDGSQNGFVAQDIEGRLCQIVDGTILPLNEINGALQLYMPAPNLSITHRGPPNGQLVSERVDHPPSQPPTSAQINALESEYSKFESELRDVDKTEVIHGRTMGKAAKDALIAKRRQLVMTMDGIRKAIKTLRDRPAQEDSVERPQTPRLGLRSDPPFLSPKLGATTTTDAKRGPYVQGPAHQPAFFAPLFMPSDDEHHDNKTGITPGPFMMAPMGYMMHPTAFDGPGNWLPPFQMYPPAMLPHDNQAVAVPQTDGATTMLETKSGSPRQSRAVQVKDPETKQVANFRSILNPMSPVYKPSVDGTDGSDKGSMKNQDNAGVRPATPPPLMYHTSAQQGHVVEPSTHAATTSSGSSIRTLDFFPQNARDHSIRKHEYPSPNISQNQLALSGAARGKNERTYHVHRGRDRSPNSPEATKVVTDPSPRAPPGTPIATNEADHAEEKTLDFSSKSHAWIKGYQAGLNRRPVGADSIGDFLDGYCSGLLKSQPVIPPEALSYSQEKECSKHAPRTAFSESDAVPFEAQLDADGLQDALAAPSNEHALLSPDPTFDKDLAPDAWKELRNPFANDGQDFSDFTLPERRSSIPKDGGRQSITRYSLGDDITLKTHVPGPDVRKSAPTTQEAEVKSYGRLAPAAHQSKRVITPLEWRTRNSLANVGSISTNLFTHAQVDGQPPDKHSPHDDREPMLANAANISGSPFASNFTSRFKEGSLDGLSPPTSPEPRSPPVSPRSNPIKRFRERRSPTKSPSSTQAYDKMSSSNRFSVLSSPEKHAKIEEKMSPDNRHTTKRGSSPNKYRWKELWKGSRIVTGKPGPP